MSRIAIRCLLILAIVYCPLQCQVGTCCVAGHLPGDDGGSDADCPCAACCPGPESSAGTQRRPAAPCGDHTPDSKCQCICAGAVIQKTDDQQVELSLSIFETAAEAAGPQVVDVFARRGAAMLPHQGRGTPGRIVCILHMSFLC